MNHTCLNHLAEVRGLAVKAASQEAVAFEVEGYVFCEDSECFYKQRNMETVLLMKPIFGKFYQPIVLNIVDNQVHVCFVFDNESKDIKLDDLSLLGEFLSDYRISVQVNDGKAVGFNLEF